MKAYLTIKNNEINPIANTSLLIACQTLEVSYDSAVRGKRIWHKKDCLHEINDSILEIKEIEIVKIKNRGRK